jgi:hypothetical protein
LKQTSTKGSGAQVVYFNIKQKRRTMNEPLENEFVTDGGLKEKYSKYCNSARVNNFLSTRCKSGIIPLNKQQINSRRQLITKVFKIKLIIH